MTKNQRELEKQIARIQSIVKKLTAGTEIEFEAPPRPKQVKQSTIDRLRKITPTTIKQQLKEVEQEKPSKITIQIETKPKRTSADTTIKKGYRTLVLSPEERARRAKKAAETRKRKGIEPFGGKRGKGNPKAKPPQLSPEQRSAAAKKATETRKQKGIKPFANLTVEQRSAAAKKAAQTRLKTTTAAQRSEWAKKAAETRKLKATEKFTTPDKDGNVNLIDLETGETKQGKVKGNKIVISDEEFLQALPPLEYPTEEEIEQMGIDEGELSIEQFDSAQQIISNYIQNINNLADDMGIPREDLAGYVVIMNAINEIMSTYKAQEFAAAIFEAYADGTIVGKKELYDADSANAYLYKFGSFLYSNRYISAEQFNTIQQSIDTLQNTGIFNYMGGIEDEQAYLRWVNSPQNREKRKQRRK